MKDHAVRIAYVYSIFNFPDYICVKTIRPRQNGYYIVNDIFVFISWRKSLYFASDFCLFLGRMGQLISIGLENVSALNDYKAFSESIIDKF